MSREVHELLKKAMALSAEDRAQLAGSLLDTLDEVVDANIEAAWQEEIARRLQELDAGNGGTVSWIEIRDRLVAKLPSRG